MKKCPYCGAQIADDSRFCTECGKEIIQANVCPHCGASVGDDDAFCQNCGKSLDEEIAPSGQSQNTCPHCGASMNEGDVFCQECGKKPTDAVNEQHKETEEYEVTEGKSGFKKYLPYILGVIVVLCLIGYCSSKDSKGGDDSLPQTEMEDSVAAEAIEEENTSSKEFIIKRLNEIFADVVKGNIIGNDNYYFSNEFVSLYEQVEKIDESVDGIGFWDAGFWGQQFDETIKKVEVKNVYDITEKDAKAAVVFHVFADGHTMAVSDTLGLVFERDGWYIDELHHYKTDMKAYINHQPTDNPNSKYVGRWSYYIVSDGQKLKVHTAIINSDMSARWITYLPDGSVNTSMDFRQCVFADGYVYFTDNGDITAKMTPRFKVGSDGLEDDGDNIVEKE